MQIVTSLTALSDWHPNLVWEDVGAAAGAVFEQNGHPSPYQLELGVEGIVDFPDPVLSLEIHTEGISPGRVARVRRTYEASRLVEMAAIAVAGLAMYHAAHLEIRDIALYGSRADYLVGERGALLEIGGRSRRSDFGTAWKEKSDALEERQVGDFYLCVVEFETPTGRLACCTASL